MAKNQHKKPQGVALSPEVSELYEVPEGVLTVFACAEFGLVDLTRINMQTAEQLEQLGYLRKKV
ncbi:MAG TPA: hypothetical protein VK658_14855 [Chryseolinea sp.]|nr:hypothetical protein [Chryseolinea sp.]